MKLDVVFPLLTLLTFLGLHRINSRELVLKSKFDNDRAQASAAGRRGAAIGKGKFALKGTKISLPEACP